MPPKKKNKKAAANPARGFATTSTVSKAKEVQPADDTKISDSKDSKGQVEAREGLATKFSLPKNALESTLANLTSNQLEAEKEESELQALVDENSVKSERDASRHVSRLHTERRLLRSSAASLATTLWFTQERLDAVLTQIASESYSRGAEGKTEYTTAFKETSVADMTIKIWTLKTTLNMLGFADNQIDATILGILSNKVSVKHESFTTSKDWLWGLEEALNYLALTSDREELPGYDSHRTEKHEREKRKFRAEQEAEKVQEVTDREALVAAVSATTSAPRSGAATPGTPASIRQDESADNDSASSDGASSADSDVDPREQLETYVKLQRQLFARHPELTIVAHKNGKSSKSNPAVTQQLSKIDPKSSKILGKIRSLEDDILFDKDTAVEKWASIRIGLLAEAAERRKYLGQASKESQSQSNSSAVHQIQAPKEELPPDDSAIDLGDFFSSLPEETTNEANGKSQLQSKSEGISVTIRDFGTWSGISPRRILEEACKARDSSSRVSYSVISSTSFSSRHSVHVQWSRPQDIPVAVAILGLTLTIDTRSASVKMTEVACFDKNQSEAFVSTAALFLIYSSSPKEEKASLRLPAVWRDLWAEFAAAKKDQRDKADRDELRLIKKLVEDHRSATISYSSNQDEMQQRLPEQSNARVKARTTTTPTVLPQISNQEGLIRVWQVKSSSPSYLRMLPGRRNLPIAAYRETLLSAIDANQAIILCGETGCGKSTQVPSYVLEHTLCNGKPCKIYCTEPRRISAISLARRVSEELGERKADVGTVRSLVGYAIRLESHVSTSTRLVFATTGIVMRMLERESDLEGITHLILDEVHERTIDSDFLLIVLRKLMVRRPDLKVILMSATVNAEQISKYMDGAPILNVPGRTYPVETKYLEDVIELTNYGADDKPVDQRPDYGHDEDEDEAAEFQQSTAPSELLAYSVRTRNVLASLNEYRLDFELIAQLLATVAVDERFIDYSKAILVFLPGMAEIRRLNGILVGHRTFSHGWEIFPLHSNISIEEQERAFLIPAPGFRKVVIATNIAETGITIPDVTCVIDVGKHKEMRFDERKQLSRLIESFISRANAKQRRGRAGRVQNGLCFHLFTRARHDRLMAESQTPEIMRLSLQDLALRVKICKLGDIDQVLSEGLDPPLPKNVRRAVDALVAVKALTVGEELTALGRQLAKLPLDVYLGKLILQANTFRCLDAGVTIAAILSSKSPFQAPMGSRSQADSTRLGFKKGESDLLTVYNAYCAWRRICTAPGISEFQWCRRNFLSPQTLSSIEDLKAQLVAALIDAGFLVLDEAGKASLGRARAYTRQRHFVELPLLSNTNSMNDLIVNSVIAWSFYPKLLIRDGRGYRSVANNQSVNLYPTSVNKGISDPPKLLSFYQIMQSSNKFYNAHETSAVEDFAAALLCGEADFKLYSGVIVLDGNRLRFSLTDWKAMLAFKALREKIREIIMQSHRTPSRSLTASQAWWYDVWEDMFTRTNDDKM